MNETALMVVAQFDNAEICDLIIAESGKWSFCMACAIFTFIMQCKSLLCFTREVLAMTSLPNKNREAVNHFIHTRFLKSIKTDKALFKFLHEI